MLPAAPLPWVSSQTTSPAVVHLGALVATAAGAGRDAAAASAVAGANAATQAPTAMPISRLVQNVGGCMMRPLARAVRNPSLLQYLRDSSPWEATQPEGSAALRDHRGDRERSPFGSADAERHARRT